MESNKSTTGKFGLIYGALAALIGIIFTLMLMVGDLLYDPTPLKPIFQTLLFIVIVVLAIYNFKKSKDGYLSLGQALAIGAITALVASSIVMLFTYLLTTIIVPDFWEQTAQITKATMLESNPSMSSKDLKNALEMQSKFTWIMYPAIFVINLIVGFFTALITGLILKKTENLY